MSIIQRYVEAQRSECEHVRLNNTLFRPCMRCSAGGALQTVLVGYAGPT